MSGGSSIMLDDDDDDRMPALVQSEDEDSDDESDSSVMMEALSPIMARPKSVNASSSSSTFASPAKSSHASSAGKSAASSSPAKSASSSSSAGNAAAVDDQGGANQGGVRKRRGTAANKTRAKRLKAADIRGRLDQWGRSRPSKSAIWEYYSKFGKECPAHLRTKAVCLVCEAAGEYVQLSQGKDGSTGVLVNHLRSFHSEIHGAFLLAKEKQEAPARSNHLIPNMMRRDFAPRHGWKEVLSEVVVKNHLPLSFVESESVKRLCSTLNHSLLYRGISLVRKDQPPRIMIEP